MPYTTIVTGTTITTSWANANVRDQGVTPFANTAARAAAITAPIEGMVTHLNDVNTLGVYSGAAWSTVGPVHGGWLSYTPAFSGWVQGNGTIDGRYMRVGRMVSFAIRVYFGSTSSVTGAINMEVPVAMIASYSSAESSVQVLGLDSSANARYTMHAASTSTIAFQLYGDATGAWPVMSATVPFTWANGDVILVAGTYEAGADA
jgi:hypothetical protein